MCAPRAGLQLTGCVGVHIVYNLLGIQVRSFCSAHIARSSLGIKIRNLSRTHIVRISLGIYEFDKEHFVYYLLRVSRLFQIDNL